jgi:zinc/manganese transport system substrate-binding protein
LTDFAALAAELGGPRVEAEALAAGTEDPHFVDAKPSHIVRMHRADLLICVGLGLESGWLPVLLTQSRNAAIQPGAAGYLDASQFIRPKDVPVKADRAMGDVHGGGNPHYYTSPAELFAVARAVHERLVQLDPAGRAEYLARWQSFEGRYRAKSAEWQAKLAPLKGTRIVEYHKSWLYLTDWMGFVAVGALEPVPGVPPSPGHVARLLQQVQGSGVKFLFQEVYHQDNLSRVFAQKSGAKQLILPGMVGATPEIKTVFDKFDAIVRLVAG